MASAAPHLVVLTDDHLPGRMDHALERRPQGPQDLAERDRSPRSGTRRISGIGVVRGVVSIGGTDSGIGEMDAVGAVHGTEDGDDLTRSAVRAKHLPITGASVQEADVGAMASSMLRSALSVAGVSLEGAALVLSVSTSRVQAKADPKRADAPVTLADVLRMAIAGGKARRAATFIRDLINDLLAEDDGRALPPASALPMLELQLEEAELAVKMRRRRAPLDGRRGLLAYEQAKRERDERERVYDRVLSKGAA